MHSNNTLPALPAGVRGAYQLQDCAMTLEEGLAEYYRVNPNLNPPHEISDPASAAWFRSHDTTHVIFGTHTGDLDEACNDVLTLFGVALPWREYVGGFLKTDEAKEIGQYYASTRIFVTLWGMLRLMPRAIRRARGMTQKWPWRPAPEDYERPIVALREAYGIRVFHAEQELARR